ncbi:MAG TPA: hypothetical protein DCY88_09735 [Cyanobacteria bacterium UBA11372]|nr:hypothetical protein [Cyanobacteria bacterium UBA11372]
MILLANQPGGFTPQVSCSQVPPGNAVLEALPLVDAGGRASRFALPGRSLVTRRSQAHEGLDPPDNSPTGSLNPWRAVRLVQDLSSIQ